MSAFGLSNFTPEIALDREAIDTIRLLASGGDERIVLDPGTGLNKYHSGPYPRTVTAYASSTANDMSVPAFARVMDLAASKWADYGERLESLRGRLRAAYRLPEDHAIAFAASGTDLEYVALAAVAGREPGGVHNILLGADEVGSGCRLSAHGMYFAGVTGCGVPSTPGDKVAGLEAVSLEDIPVRCARGLAHDSLTMLARIRDEIAVARAAGKHPLVHVVHGSKTGLILPELPELDRLLAEEGEGVTLVVDACQARVTTEALHAYLERGAIVFLTGSKFMGGPPFSGFALIPPQVAARAEVLPSGLANVFRRAEWPRGWPGSGQLAELDNPGLWLRLEASIFEVERFQQLDLADIERVLDAFEFSFGERLIGGLGFGRVNPFPPGHEREAGEHPIEMRTLATIDVSRLPDARTFDEAQALHKALALAGLRLGQPVRSVRTPEGDWAGTLRIGLSMPQMVEWAALDAAALRDRFAEGMDAIAEALDGERRVKAA